MYNLVGHKWGPYSIIAHIGQDDLGVVYRAQEVTSGRRVRLWILPFSMTRDNDALKRRLEMLVSRLQGLSHPHVAAVHGLEEVEGHLCVVLEDVPGQTLREVLIERKRLGAHQANKILQDLAAAVEALYQAGIQDLDLCPSHVVLTPSGQAVLVACEVIHLVRSMAIPSRGHAVVGSPVYIAPEMAKGSPPNGRSAVYSLGIMLYEMLTGHPPFEGGDAEVILAHQNLAPPPLSQAARRVPQAVEQAVTRALAKDPQERYAAPLEMADDLGEETRPLLDLARLPKVHLPLRLVAVVILLGLVGWAAFGLLQDRSPTRTGSLASYSGYVGTYEIITPKRIQADETASLRLVVRPASSLLTGDLPASPTQLVEPVEDSALAGVVPLCKQLWATLESPMLDVIGPSTIRRTLRDSGAEWVWQVCCKGDTPSAKTYPATIRIFARSDEADDHEDILVKSIHFEVQMSSLAGMASQAELGVAVIGVALVGVVALLIATRRRPTS